MNKFVAALGLAVAGCIPTTAMAVLNAQAEEPENIALGKEIYGRVKSGVEDTNPAINAIDGDPDTFYCYNGEYIGGDGWVVIDLGDDYVVSSIMTTWTRDLGTFRISYAREEYEPGVKTELPPANYDNIWTFTGVFKGWVNSDPIKRKMDEEVGIEYDEPLVARYIAVRDVDNPGGQPELHEVIVHGVLFETQEATAIKMSIDPAIHHLGTDEKAVISASVIDQYGLPMPDETVTLTCNDENATLVNGELTVTKAGLYTVYAESGDLKSSITVLYAADESSRLNATFTGDAVTVTRDGEVLTQNPFNGNEIQFNQEEGVITDKEVVITFDKPYDFSLLRFRWEAACPQDYKVIATDVRGAQRTILEVTGRKFVGGVNPVDRVWHNVTPSGVAAITSEGAQNDLSGIKSLTIAPTSADHNYALRLFGIDAFGTESAEEIAQEYYIACTEGELAEDADSGRKGMFHIAKYVFDVKSNTEGVEIPESVTFNWKMLVSPTDNGEYQEAEGNDLITSNIDNNETVNVTFPDAGVYRLVASYELDNVSYSATFDALVFAEWKNGGANFGSLMISGEKGKQQDASNGSANLFSWIFTDDAESHSVTFENIDENTALYYCAVENKTKANAPGDGAEQDEVTDYPNDFVLPYYSKFTEGTQCQLPGTSGFMWLKTVRNGVSSPAERFYYAIPSKADDGDIETGVGEVTVAAPLDMAAVREAAAEGRVFDITGTAVGPDSLNGGLYIVVIDGKAHKLMVK